MYLHNIVDMNQCKLIAVFLSLFFLVHCNNDPVQSSFENFIQSEEDRNVLGVITTQGSLSITNGDASSSKEIDTDTDGINDTEDNCPLTANKDQKDNDTDGFGDICDNDDDNDGIIDESDNCPFVANEDQKDSDKNSVGDICENDFYGH